MTAPADAAATVTATAPARRVSSRSSFGETPALRGASVSIAAGELLAVMGPSGSGKSTLLHCLAGILVPDSGEVHFAGQRLDTLRERRAQRAAPRPVRVRVPVRPARARADRGGERRPAAAARRRRPRRGARPGSRLVRPARPRRDSSDAAPVSCPAARPSGSRSRVAWSPSPDVVFADEPTGSLDSLAGEQVMELLVGAARDQGTTVVLVTHEPRIAAYADREIIVRDGKVATPVRAAAVIRLGVRLAVAGGQGSDHPAGADRRRGRHRVGPAADHARRASTPFDAQNQRYAWLETGYPGAERRPRRPRSSARPAVVAAARRRLPRRADRPRRPRRHRPDSPVPPGIPALPAPGRVLRLAGARQAAARHAAGRARRPLPRHPGRHHRRRRRCRRPDTPDHRHRPRCRRRPPPQPTPDQSPQISTTSPDRLHRRLRAGVGTNANGMTLVLSVVAAALLFPVLVFIGGATRLSAARREQRFAAMRLVGATPRQISTIATVESSVATVAGVAVGFGLFAVAPPAAIAHDPVHRRPLLHQRPSLDAANVLLVGRRRPGRRSGRGPHRAAPCRTSPRSASPGASRRGRPRARRLDPRCSPASAGSRYLAYFSDIGASHNSSNQAYAYLLGVFSIMIGLVVAGPWLTMLGARLTARRADRPDRSASPPAASATTRKRRSGRSAAWCSPCSSARCAIGIITTIIAYNAGAAGDTADSTGTLVHDSSARPERFRPDHVDLRRCDRHELTSIAGRRRRCRGALDTERRSAGRGPRTSRLVRRHRDIRRRSGHCPGRRHRQRSSSTSGEP